MLGADGQNKWAAIKAGDRLVKMERRERVKKLSGLDSNGLMFDLKEKFGDF